MFHLNRLVIASCLVFIASCAVPKYIPQDLDHLKTEQELSAASQQAYHEAKAASEKEEKLKQSQAGILYAQKCLRKNDQQISCLYYDVLNTGIFVQNHFPGYQKHLQKMVSHCEKVVKLEPAFEHGGCFRVLGNIYREVPSFSLSSKGITKDLDLSVNYLRQGVQIAPTYPLNHLFLAESLEEIGENEEAIQELKEFDRLKTEALDQEYPSWKKERDKLAQKLL